MRARGTFNKVSGMEPARRRALSGRRAVSAPRRRSREEDTRACEDDATGVPESREPFSRNRHRERGGARGSLRAVARGSMRDADAGMVDVRR